MMDDFRVKPRPAKAIEATTLAWRHALGVTNNWAPDMVRLIESDLPNVLPTPFALVVRDDADMADAEAYTEFNPAHIAIRKSTYYLARKFDGRSRMTLAHELGHLVMHVSDGPRPRAVEAKRSEIPHFESAEWQASKFASLFLMPTHIVRQVESVESLIAYCRVSRQAAEIRFKEAGHVPKTIPECAQTLASELRSRQPIFPKPKLVT
jgi:Zn-dependent peptidase ImmA (M78 family)